MNDIDTLIARLRAVAREHEASLPLARAVTPRPWSPAGRTGVRDALVEAWAAGPTSDVAPFLVTDPEDFVSLAFLAYVGRHPDPVGRSHYLGLLQQARPRLEVVAEMAGTPEAVGYRGKARWPLWLYLLLRTMRMPFGLARRVGRAVLRRVEARMARAARGSATGLAWRLATSIDERDRVRDADVDALARELGERIDRHGEAVASRLSGVDERLSVDGAALDKQATALAAIRAHIAVLEHDRPSVAAPMVHSDATAPARSHGPADPLTRYYLTLESAFRGDPQRIRRQLETDYLARMVEARDEAGPGPCLDLGCGRGEWLEVLREHGFDARGVDLNPYMAAEAQEKGNDVAVADAISFLRGMPDDSALAISAFHLAEHLEFPTLYELIGECRRVLKPGGRLILETPNPENVWVATHTFHHDPTHRNPLTPSSLEFLVNHHGLETVAVLRLHPYPDEARLPGNDAVSERLNGMTCGPQDFAVIARKTAPA